MAGGLSFVFLAVGAAAYAAAAVSALSGSLAGVLAALAILVVELRARRAVRRSFDDTIDIWEARRAAVPAAAGGGGRAAAVCSTGASEMANRAAYSEPFPFRELLTWLGRPTPPPPLVHCDQSMLVLFWGVVNFSNFPETRRSAERDM